MRRVLLVIVLAVALSFLVYPHALLSPKNTLPDDNDTRLIAYIIGQVQRNLTTGKPFYYATYFAPYENTLTYSEPFAVSAILTLPFYFIHASPIFVANMAYLFGFMLTFVSCYLLLEFLCKNSWSALFSSVLFSLSGYHLVYFPHLQMSSLWLILSAIYFFLRYQKENKDIFLNLFLVFFTAQITESLFGSYLIFFAVLIIFIFSPKNIKKIIRHTLFFVPFWLIFIFPYLKLHFTFPEATRPIRDAANFSLGLEEIFTKYHSWTFVAIFLSSLILKSKNKLIPFYFLLSTSLILSLGPVVKFLGHSLKPLQNLGVDWPIPLPYSLFYYLFPGFKGFRTPSRFIILAALSVTIIITQKLVPLAKKILPQTKFFLLTLLILLLSFENHFPLPSYPIDITLPPVYQEVSRLPSTAIILELPIKLWTGPGHEIESVRSLYSLEHGHRRVNGFSGFSPLSWIDLVNKITENGLDPENLNRLHALGVTHVVEDNRLYPLP